MLLSLTCEEHKSLTIVGISWNSLYGQRNIDVSPTAIERLLWDPTFG